MQTTELSNKRVALIGLGYVGLPLAVEFGKYRNVVGFDIDAQRIKELKAGFDRTLECSEQELLSAKNLSYTSNEADLGSCDWFIVTVPTPIDNANRPNLKPLTKACALIGQYIKEGSLIIFESTVFPGATEEVCVPIIEKQSGLTFNVDFFCGYSPERVNPGDKVNTLTKIVKVVSGSTPEVTHVIDALYSEIITAGTITVSSLKVAEASKVIENAQRDLNIAFVNELSVIFERLGLDTMEVLEAAGTKWNFLPFRPGMVGGHCISVDPYYLTYRAEQAGYKPEVILAGRRMNDNMSRYAARNVIKRMVKCGVNLTSASVAICGVTFKENCPDIRNSKIIDLINEFKSWGVQVSAVDPWACPDEVFVSWGVQLKSGLEVSSYDAVILAVGHDQYRSMNPKDFWDKFKHENAPILADLKSIYNRQECVDSGFEVFRL